MSRAAQSVFIFGIYLIGTAGLLITTPNTLLSPLGFQTATEPWIRVVGVVVGAIGFYYVSMARANVVAFLAATVWARLLVLVGFIALAGLSWAPPMIIGFGVVDALGALWTWTALRSKSA